ncbi:MAG: M91 family zinc metallopeptidase [Actinocatenispora sp.]
MGRPDTDPGNDADPQEPEQAPVVTADLWHLGADTAAIDAAARGWAGVLTAAGTSASTMDTPARKLEPDWSGDTAETYRDHRVKLSADIAGLGDVASDLDARLGLISGSLAKAQELLDDGWASISGAVPATSLHGSVTFHPETAAQTKLVKRAITDAGEVRDWLDDALSRDVGALATAAKPLAGISTTWARVAEGTNDGFTLPPEATGGPAVIVDGDRVIVNTGTGDDTVSVETDPGTGQQVVTVNGKTLTFPPGQQITVRGGEGNDTISVPLGSHPRLVLLGGQGDDTVQGGAGRETTLGLWGDDNLYGGAGDDRISGGAGRDYVEGDAGDDTLTGGDDKDVIYGLDGADTVDAGEGDDYVDGGHGDDTLTGGGGKDIVSGGTGDDTVRAGAGADTVYGGGGTDSVDGGPGSDTTYVQTDDTTVDAEHVVTVEYEPDLGDTIHIEGSPEFVARMQSDLETLRSSPDGQLMLTEQDDIHNSSKAPASDWPVLGHIAYQGDVLTIKETHDANGYASYHQVGPDFHPLSKSYTVQINPAWTGAADSPPVAVLYHELGHVYDYGNDTTVDGSYDNPADPDQNWDDDKQQWVGVPNAEREAAGLPVDDDHDPDTPYRIAPDHPIEYTENGLRREMGLPDRPKYGQ